MDTIAKWKTAANVSVYPCFLLVIWVSPYTQGLKNANDEYVKVLGEVQEENRGTLGVFFLFVAYHLQLQISPINSRARNWRTKVPIGLATLLYCLIPSPTPGLRKELNEGIQSFLTTERPGGAHIFPLSFSPLSAFADVFM